VHPLEHPADDHPGLQSFGANVGVFEYGGNIQNLHYQVGIFGSDVRFLTVRDFIGQKNIVDDVS
jgi:hypothetical protein